MPYTPPSHRSPASSAPTSPNASRRPSIHAPAVRPSLPRSASYLTKHRRTPSAVGPIGNVSITQPSPEATSEDLKGMMATSMSVRQSPPPVTSGQVMPNGAILSPPESSASSDEDDLPPSRGRQVANLQELHDAISQIPQHREASPGKENAGAGDLLVLPNQSVVLHQSFSASSLEDIAQAARRISHSRSATEPNALISKSADNSLTGSEEDSEGDLMKKPQMVRKKSGELVRPALRPPSRRRPSSMPGTPTFSKAVHFDSHLEHVRHFLQVDRPLAVSAGSSPVDNYDSDSEYPFNARTDRRSPPYEWEIIMTNFPIETPARKAQPVRLERVWLSNDQKCLTGSIAVANIAFHKSVSCRFTLDYWKTTSEVSAEYSAEIRPRETEHGHDRFNFTIKLSDTANLEAKTLFFCVRYGVNGHDFWDNNSGTNFQVDFKKKMLPQNGKNHFQGASSRPLGGLPRSNRRSNPSYGARPKSMPVTFDDDFGDNPKIDFDQSLHEYLGEPGPALRLKSGKSTTSLPSDNLTTRLSSPSGQAFANRYDFGASLSAAVQAAKDNMTRPDGLYMKPNVRKQTAARIIQAKPPVPAFAKPEEAFKPSTAPAPLNKIVAPATTGADSPASIASASYEELVNKYCFFGSKQSSPQLKDGTFQGNQMDGSVDLAAGTGSTNSSNPSLAGSPLQLAGLRSDVNPFFQGSMSFVSLSASPVPSPLRTPTERTMSPQPQQPRTTQFSVPGQSTSRSLSPASMVAGIPSYAGTSPSPIQQLQDHFPFYSSGAHSAAAIRG